MRAVALLIALVGCYQATPPSGVPCASDGDCPRGLQCDHSHAPPICVEQLPIEPDAGVDAIDAPPDMPPDVMVPPAFVMSANSNGGGIVSLSYALVIPPGTDRFLLVSVQLGSN